MRCLFAGYIGAKLAKAEPPVNLIMLVDSVGWLRWSQIFIATLAPIQNRSR